ncbi:MAG: diaminopropionate ammonia-lyase [Anaerovoracaceae bacterium]|jgi:diaminopropionate ammonia-lyase
MSYKVIKREHADGEKNDISYLSREAAEKVRKFHRSFPEYSVTPLQSLPETAQAIGVSRLYVKDESYRFGLNAFKVLGASYAMGNVLAQRLGVDISDLAYDRLVSQEVRDELGSITFVTATDGNHGRGVAWTAKKLGQKSVVYMPEGTSAERLVNIRREGASATITDMNYDESVRLAARKARENDWVMVQDTSWEGYQEIPRWIMQGYGTMALEAGEQLSELGEEGVPTHIFLQAGVGAMAGAVTGYFASMYGDAADNEEIRRPTVVIVEPNAADCYYRTVKANDGTRHVVEGKLDTIMVGLACGEPCIMGWDVLQDYADYFISCPDEAAMKGMRILGNPAGADPRIISGESGASAFGCVASIMSDPDLEDIREELGIDEDSRLLFFSTEGATDTADYRRIVWG